MFDKWTQYSYAAQKYQRYRFIKFLFGLIILYIIYNCLTAFFFSVWVIENDTMQPGLISGDRLIFYSFTPPAFISKINPADQSISFKRGSIVLIDMGHDNKHKLPLRIIDGIVRFFSAQRISVFSGEGRYFVKRVIGLPGDEIYMTDFVFRVKPSGSLYNLTEFELSEKPYHPAIPQYPSLWDESIPFSGNMESIILGKDECFVVSDDRSNTNDSRTWGPVPATFITARAVFRFWPFTKIGLP
jgi:signal peptidase I